MTWENANKTCKHRGGTIVAINNNEEKEFVTNIMINKKTRNAWLGLIRIKDRKEANCGSNITCIQSNLKWQDGTLLNKSVLSLISKENEISIDYCVVGIILQVKGVVLKLISCDESHMVICEGVNVCKQDHFVWGPNLNDETKKTSCYDLNDKTTWKTANATCIDGGKTLVSIDDDDEEKYVRTQMLKNNINKAWTPKESNENIQHNQQWQDGSDENEFCPFLQIDNIDEFFPITVDQKYCTEKVNFICEKEVTVGIMTSSIDSHLTPTITSVNRIDGNTQKPTTAMEVIEPVPGEECIPNYCSNGATCTVVSVIKRVGLEKNSQITDIKCTCPSGYVGKLCNDELDMLVYTYATMRFLIDYNPVFADSKHTQTRQFKARVIKELRLAIRNDKNALFLNLVSIWKGSVIAVFEIGFMSNEKTLDKEKITYSVIEALSSEASDGLIGGMSVDQSSINIVSVQNDKNECMLSSTMPCQNGAECLDGDRHYTCLCHPQYYGEFCQHTNTSDLGALKRAGSNYKWNEIQAISRSDQIVHLHFGCTLASGIFWYWQSHT